MTPFDSGWERYATIMDDAVDDKLGDRILLSLSGGPFVTVPAFVVDENQAEGLDDLDGPLGNRKRVKIRKTIMPLVSQTHRIQHPRLGTGSFKPGSALPDTDGRYWLFDVQKA